jgi:hypothetical protein
MAGTDMPAGASPGNLPDDILVRLSGLVEARLRVAADQDLGAVEIHVALIAGSGTFAKTTVLIGAERALDLCLRTIGAVSELRKLEMGDAP